MDQGARRSALKDELSQAAEKLELGAILEMVAGQAASERTAGVILSAPLLGTIGEIEKRQNETLELMKVRQNGKDLPMAGWRDSASEIEGIRAEGMTSSGEDLVAIAAAERKAGEVSRFIERSGEDLPLISEYLNGFRIHDDIVRRIEKTIGPDFEVLDRASPELTRLRREVGKLRSRLRNECADFVSAHTKGRGEEFVTVRGERFVVSLPRDEASHVKGIVHHQSGSGASLFMEPLEFVEENNRLEASIRKERDEVLRILAALTSEVYTARNDLSGNQNNLLTLDAIRARAVFAEKYRCVLPRHSTDGTLVLRSARHPILEKGFADEGEGREVTGLDLTCGESLRTLVISGPNAGGKTVALKTIGLMIMMDRHGLLLPCLDGTVVPDHPAIFVDIGDDQSIERSLSTFSSRVAKMKRILELACPDSIVLVDEIGDGTDPEEGAALAGALLEDLSSRCGRTVVTTHMSFLKGWAHDTGYAGNATLEFDPDELQPLYRMKMGIPGRSWGIETAGRMGLPGEIIDRARENMASPSLKLEELLAELERTEQMLASERENLIKKEEELERLIGSYRSRLDHLENNREELEQEARREALDIVKSTRVEMERLVKDIRTAQAERKVIARSKQGIEKRAEQFEKTIKPLRPKGAHEPVDPGTLAIGQWVMIISLGREGKVIEIEGVSRILVELPGGMRVETKAGDLSKAKPPKLKPKKPKISFDVPRDGSVETELMIRGLERAEAMEKVDAFIDRAALQDLGTVQIIHGIGRGILKKAVYDMLRSDPRVADVRPGEPALGGDGVAVVRLK
jgi:DNA mismatch repair protein MutS2